MNCEKAAKLLALRAGGDLPAPAAGGLSAHVDLCPACRGVAEELARTVAWLRAPATPPLTEEDYGSVRRSVWRRIEAGGGISARRSPLRGRLLLAGAGMLAAAVAALLLVVRAPQEPPIASVRPTEPLPVEIPPAASREVEAPPAPVASPPVPVAPSSPPPRIRRHRAAPASDSGVARIEFRTANPNVRIIWLVRKGGEESSPPSAGRNQEVS